MATTSEGQIRWFLVAELVVSFAPVTLLLVIGLLMSPFQIVMLFSSGDPVADLSGVLYVVGVSLVGLLAMIRFARVAADIVRQTMPSAPRGTTVCLLVLGVGSLIHLIADSGTNLWRLVFFMPLVVTLHFVYLGRHYFLPEQVGSDT